MESHYTDVRKIVPKHSLDTSWVGSISTQKLLARAASIPFGRLLQQHHKTQKGSLKRFSSLASSLSLFLSLSRTWQ